MANPHKGEVELVAGEAAYTLRFDINAIVEMETMLDIGMTEIFARLSDQADMRLGLWRAALWASLRSRHKGISLEMAGDIIAQAGMLATIAAVGEAMRLAFPEAAPNPQPASPAAAAGATSS